MVIDFLKDKYGDNIIITELEHSMLIQCMSSSNCYPQMPIFDICDRSMYHLANDLEYLSVNYRLSDEGNSFIVDYPRMSNYLI